MHDCLVLQGNGFHAFDACAFCCSKDMLTFYGQVVVTEVFVIDVLDDKVKRSCDQDTVKDFTSGRLLFRAMTEKFLL